MTAYKKFNKIFKRKNIRDIYNDRIKLSNAIGLDRVRPQSFYNRLDSEVEIILRKIDNNTYKFTCYKEKLISKGQGKNPRIISIPTTRDRIVLRALCDFLGDVFPSIKLTLPQIVIESLSNALTSNQYGEYVKIDLKNFYPSIPHGLIFKELRKKIRKPSIINLIRKSIETPTVSGSRGRKNSNFSTIGVPQGLAISNILVEIALQRIDAKYKTMPNIWFNRYVDDILVLTPNGLAEEIANDIINDLKIIGLIPHPIGEVDSKSVRAGLSTPFSFLGYQVNRNKISVKRESILRLESSLANIFTAYRHRLVKSKNPLEKQTAINYCRWKLNLRITGCIFEGRRLGWVFYFSQINDSSCLRAIDNTVKSLIDRFNLKSNIKPKSFLKTYYESKRRNKSDHKYIVNFDTMSITEQRYVLSLMLGRERIADLPDSKISSLFKMKISAAVRELEADISMPS